MRSLSAVVALVLLAGCAKQSDEVTASYVSPVFYQNHTCDQLSLEAQAVSAEVSSLSGSQDDAATRDAIATGVGVVLFWPALLVLAAGDDSAQLAGAKGRMQAIESAAILKECSTLTETLRESRRRSEEALARKRAEQDKRDAAWDD